MTPDTLLNLIVDILAPHIATDPTFFARAVLRVYIALERAVACNDIGMELKRKAEDVRPARYQRYAGREQTIFGDSMMTFLPELRSGQITKAHMLKVIIALCGGERDEVDVEEALVELAQVQQ